MASRVLSTCLITPPTRFTHASPLKLSNKASWLRSKNRRIKCEAVGDSSQPVYNGVYGPWTVESSDVREVLFNLKVVVFPQNENLMV